MIYLTIVGKLITKSELKTSELYRKFVL